MRRDPRRWRTRFGRFVGSVGVERLTVQLRSAGQPVTHKAVYNWLAGDHAPRPGYAAALVQISRGRIGIADVYRHRWEVGRSSGPRRP
jgi:hypothetical protein